MNSDFKELLESLHESEVRYLVAGGYAVIHHSQPRYTKDIDIWLEPTPENARKLMRAFRAFGIPMVGVPQEDFTTPGTQFSIGVPPCEIDFLTTIPGLEFAPSWENRVTRRRTISRFIISEKRTSSEPRSQPGACRISQTSRKSAAPMKPMAKSDHLRFSFAHTLTERRYNLPGPQDPDAS